MTHRPDPDYGDYWSVRVDIPATPKPHPASAWGTLGRYVYRYFLQDPNTPHPIDWIIDPFAREYLETYHVDGFRYDCVPNYWDGPVGQGYASLVNETYQTVKANQAEGGHWQRFFENGGIRLLQCAEQLEGPVEIVEKTYSNFTWQNETLGAAQAVAKGREGDWQTWAFDWD